MRVTLFTGIITTIKQKDQALIDAGYQAIQHYDWDRQQWQKQPEEQEHPFKRPALFVEIGDYEFEDRAGRKYAPVPVTITIVQDYYVDAREKSTTQPDAFSKSNYSEYINEYLDNLQLECLGKLEFIGEESEEEYGNQLVDRLKYTAHIYLKRNVVVKSNVCKVLSDYTVDELQAGLTTDQKGGVCGGSGSEPLYTYPYASFNTGADTIYAVGDDKWVMDNILNTEISSWPTDRPWIFPVLDPNDSTELLFGCNPDGSGNNIFRNKQRFTAANGSQMFTNYILDHYLGIGYSIYNPVTANNWETSIAEIESLTQAGFNDWHLTNLRILNMLSDWTDNLPLSLVLSKISSSLSVNQGSSTTRSNGTSQAMFLQSLLRVGFGNKSSALMGNIIFRKAFTYNPSTQQMELS